MLRVVTRYFFLLISFSNLSSDPARFANVCIVTQIGPVTNVIIFSQMLLLITYFASLLQIISYTFVAQWRF